MYTYSHIIQNLRSTFNSGRTQPIVYRERQLQNLLLLIEDNKSSIVKALYNDLHRNCYESEHFEIQSVIDSINCALNNIKEWTTPERPSKCFMNIFDEIQILSDPYGVVLIIGSWNYPFSVTLIPAVSAIAAGNCVVIKPSEIAPATAELILSLFPKYLDNDCYKIVLGGPEDVSQLLKCRFDYIFFTGSNKVGKIVHAAASKFLTPTTLELGGKNPVYLDNSVTDVKIAARRILWGKLLNSGQTCIAPDYLLCTKVVGEQFLACARAVINEFYSEDSYDFGRIVNKYHFDRLTALLDSNKVVLGGTCKAEENFIEPTILADVKPSDLIMQEEIFGPILPLIYVEDVRHAIKIINAGEKPLVLYIFSEDDTITDLLLNKTFSGGVNINDTMTQYLVDTLPFGGVGASGMGAYHAKFGFDTFVHKKGVLIRGLGRFQELMNRLIRYPPYTETKTFYIKWFLKIGLIPIPSKIFIYFCLFNLGLATAITTIYIMQWLESKKNMS